MGQFVFRSPSSAPGSDVFFAMDYSAGAATDAGWTLGAGANYGLQGRDTPYCWSLTRVAAGGPQGQDAYDIANLYSTDFRPEFFGGQNYWGWGQNIEASDPPRQVSRFYRFRLKFSADTNFRSRDWGTGSLGAANNKILIIGDGGNPAMDPSRVIIEYTGQLSPIEVLRIRLQIDGGSYPAITGPWPIDTWLNIQIEIRSASAFGVNDGYHKIWVNNNNYASPSNEVLNFPLNPENWRFVRFGAFNSSGPWSDGVHTFRTCDFQAATSFDSGWNV